MGLFTATRGMFIRMRGVLKTNDDGKFWIAQIFMLISTVVGVYLAASIGFDRALTFDQLVKKRAAYHMLITLEDEIDKNHQILYNFAEWSESVHIMQAQRIDDEEIQNYYRSKHDIWEAMQESSEMFLISPKVLIAVREYNDRREDLVYSASSMTSGIHYVRKQTVKLEEEVYNNLKQEIAADILRLRTDLGIPEEPAKTKVKEIPATKSDKATEVKTKTETKEQPAEQSN